MKLFQFSCLVVVNGLSATLLKNYASHYASSPVQQQVISSARVVEYISRFNHMKPTVRLSTCVKTINMAKPIDIETVGTKIILGVLKVWGYVLITVVVVCIVNAIFPSLFAWWL